MPNWTDDEGHSDYKRRKQMPRKKKSILIKVGAHLVDPTDVSCISKLRNKNLYIVRLKSQPNMQFPIWVKVKDIEPLLDYFEIKVTDVVEDEE